MPNYQDSKIYTIRSHQTKKIYVGSTCNELRKRLYQHKQKYKIFLKNKSIFISSFEIIKYDDCFIELYEKYPCNDRMELHKREGEIIRSLDCVNKNIAGRTIKEHYQDNKKKILEKNKKYKKEYRIKNKEKIKEYEKKRIEKKIQYTKEYRIKNKEKIKDKITKNIYLCSCGSKIRKDSKNRHEKTKKHINFINNN